MVEEAYAQSERLSSLVQSLLLLNRLEDAPHPEKKTVVIGEVCEQWIRALEPTIHTRGLHITVRQSETAAIRAIPTHADILIHNLLENAAKYATPDSEVCLTIAVQATTTRLSLFNLCPTFSAWDEKRLFEPFYRPDISRNSDTGGNGLGLAICKTIADANGWELRVVQENGGIRAEITFKHD